MNRMTTLGMWRTEHVKFPTYHGDGQGRDMSILINNGGLIPSPMFKGLAPKNDYNKSVKVKA